MTDGTTSTELDSPRLPKCHCRPPPEGTTSRNLVVCIDGTSNKFGIQNTNIVELYRCLEKDKSQITYYNSGTGTHTKRSSLHLPILINFLDKTIDLAIAWNFQEIVTCAYRWLSEQYQEGDLIFLFGFSRGAYQVRALAGMIAKVGLIPVGNWEQIPFAYDFYAHGDEKTGEQAEDFRRTFSRAAHVHFVGVWDTVSSVGIVRGKNLPLTETSNHVCFFRHALALDECRVKFLPEYIKEHPPSFNSLPERAKEVWFAGSHSDVGGRLASQTTLTDSTFAKDVRNMSLLWMQNEALTAGLHLEQSIVNWDFKTLRDERPTKSLLWSWWLFELIPVRRQRRYSPRGETRKLHRGKGRAIQPGQKIHFSVAFKHEAYTPKATLRHIGSHKWESLVGHKESDEVPQDGGSEGLWELDLFDSKVVHELIRRLGAETPAPSTPEVIHLLMHLNSMISFQSGKQAIINTPNALSVIADRLFKQDGSNKVASELLRELLPESRLPEAIYSLADMLVVDSDVVRSTAAKLLNLLPGNDPGSRLDMILPLVETISKNIGDDVKGKSAKILQGFIRHEVNRSADDVKPPILVSDAIPRVIEILKAADRGARGAAAEFLEIFVRHGTDDRSTPESSLESTVTRPLLKILNGGDGVRKSATELLKRFAEGDERVSIFTSDVVNSLVDMLASNENGAMRNTAAELLKTLAPHRDVLLILTLETKVNPALAKMLGSDDNATRTAGELILEFASHDDIRALIVKSSVIHSLVEILKGADNARNTAIELCKKLIPYHDIALSINKSDVIPSLVGMLEGDGNAMKCRTLELFRAFAQDDDIRATIRDCNVIRSVVKMIEANDDGVRNAATGFLTDFAKYGDVRASVFDSDVIVSLVEILKNHDGSVRNLAAGLVKALAQSPDVHVRASIVEGQAIQSVVKMLEDLNDGVRSTAAGLLEELSRQDDIRASIFTSDVIFSLVKVLEVEDDGARSTAARLFKEVAQHHDVRASIVQADAIHSIIEMLRAHNPGVRNSASGLLQEFALQDDVRTSIFTLNVISSLAKTLERDQNGSRSTAIELFKALAQYHDVLTSILTCDAIPSVVKMLKARDDGVRDTAAGLLKKFAVHDDVRGSNFESTIILPVVGMLEDRHPSVRATAADLLKEFAIHDDIRSSVLKSSVIPRVVEILGGNDDGVRMTAAELLTELALHHDVRASIFEPQVIPSVVKMLQAREDGVRSAASGLLKAFALYDDIRASILGSSVIPPLVEMLENYDDGVRSTAAGLLKGFALHDDVRVSIFKSDVIPPVAKIMIEAHKDEVRKSAAVLLKDLALHDDMHATVLECSRLHQLVRRGDDDKGTTGASLESLPYQDALDTVPHSSILTAITSKLQGLFFWKE